MLGNYSLNIGERLLLFDSDTSFNVALSYLGMYDELAHSEHPVYEH